MTRQEIVTYTKFIMSKFKGCRPGEGVRAVAVTSSIHKQYPMEYRLAISVYILLMVNDYLQEDSNSFVKLTENGYSLIHNNEEPILYLNLPSVCNLDKPREQLFYQVWDFIGEQQQGENPFYVKGSDFFNVIRTGLEGLPANYTLYTQSLPNEPNGLKPSRFQWYKSLFCQLNDNQVIPFLERLSNSINKGIQPIEQGNDDNWLLEDTVPQKLQKQIDLAIQAMTEEEKLVQALKDATELYSIQWVHVGKYVYETSFNGTLYQVYMLIKPYSESHEYFSYGLDVYYESWKNIVIEEEDPESSLLTPMGEQIKELIGTCSNPKHCIEGKSQIKKENQYMENNNVFIVHGHDTALRTEVELFLTKLSLIPIVLFKEANKGSTIIEKFLEHAGNCCFAIVLYTYCDEGKDKKAADLKPRARQNVVFEHGFMYSHLGRDKVVALVENGVEIPGDLSGVVYITRDNEGKWKSEILKELQAAKVPFDQNRIIEALS